MRSRRFGLGTLCFGTSVIAAACSGSSDQAPLGGPDASSDAPVSADAANGGDAPSGDAPSGDASVPSDASAEAGAGPDAGIDSTFNAPQPISPFIVVDQFGYRSSAEKIAVIRNPQVGFDSLSHFAPGTTYAVVDAHSAVKLLEGAPVVWNGGATDTSSGDAAWWFDFSSVTTTGDYFVLDEAHNVRSDVFHVSDDVYRGVLGQATRMFYYQRDGIAKVATYAGASWADGVGHPQDASCGLYQADGGAPLDLRGGWYDGGDQSKYTNFAASDVIELLRAYTENPGAFRDDTNIPESGNGVPDVLDEAKWGLDWLARMQNADGSLLSLVAHAGATPPSADTTPCVYGPANTSATWTAAAAFAQASIVFGASSAFATAYPGYAAGLHTKAVNAWTWAVANPAVVFSNFPALAGREQEVDAGGRLDKEVQAAAFLFELTGAATYQSVFDANYAQLPTSPDPFQADLTDTLLEYTKIPGATGSVVASIASTFQTNTVAAMASNASADPYLAYLATYPVGSNEGRGGQGNLFYDLVSFGLGSTPDAGPDASASSNAVAVRSAERYVHYLHGVNPMQLVYLSNMQDYGAESYVTRFFSQWFAPGSTWDAVGVSKYGPPPGFLTAGPFPGYTWDACCPSSCGGAGNAQPELNALCGMAPLSPPSGQPAQKAYKDFNTSWPIDSWTVTEPRNTYQAQYVRLLSKFSQ